MISFDKQKMNAPKIERERFCVKQWLAEAKEQRDKHAILLMDGEEARAVFNGFLFLDELLKRKRQHFDQLSNPYHRVLSKAEVS
jgi:hypothetical protein